MRSPYTGQERQPGSDPGEFRAKTGTIKRTMGAMLTDWEHAEPNRAGLVGRKRGKINIKMSKKIKTTTKIK